MRRLSGIALAAALVGLVCAPATRPAAAGGISIGGYGGASIPIKQDDNGRGTLFGARVDAQLIPLLTVEPYYEKTGGGDVTQTIGGVSYSRVGVDVSAYGVNALLRFGGPFSIYPYVGVGKHKVTRVGTPDHTLTGYNGGLGIALSPAPGFTVDVRGEANVIRQDGLGRTFANVTAGLSYRVFKLP